MMETMKMSTGNREDVSKEMTSARTDVMVVVKMLSKLFEYFRT